MAYCLAGAVGVTTKRRSCRLPGVDRFLFEKARAKNWGALLVKEFH